jgi:hypothetical protein
MSSDIRLVLNKKTHYVPRRRYDGDCDYHQRILSVRELLLLGDEVKTKNRVVKGQGAGKSPFDGDEKDNGSNGCVSVQPGTCRGCVLLGVLHNIDSRMGCRIIRHAGHQTG